MEEVRKVEGLTLEELEAQSVELLPDREELHHRRRNLFSNNLAIAVQGSTANAGNVFVIDL
jgi:hypothetical protein